MGTGPSDQQMLCSCWTRVSSSSHTLHNVGAGGGCWSVCMDESHCHGLGLREATCCVAGQAQTVIPLDLSSGTAGEGAFV